MSAHAEGPGLSVCEHDDVKIGFEHHNVNNNGYTSPVRGLGVNLPIHMGAATSPACQTGIRFIC
jgi:hypothetical protein